MKCTSCNEGELSPSFIEGLFRAHTCTSCGGNWILIEDYCSWKEMHPEYVFTQKLDYEFEDTKSAMLCPITGGIMQKFKFSHGSNRRLDYSPAVGGVWLDKGEWEYLKQEKLAGSLNAIITSHWQESIRKDSAKNTLSEIYKERFGEESYIKAIEIREWINSHPRKSDIRAFILAADPHSAER